MQATPTITVPGRTTVAAHGSADLIFPRRPSLPPGNLTYNLMGIENESDVPAAISDDGERLTVDVAAGERVVADADCEPAQEQPNRVICAHGADHPADVSVAAGATDDAAALPQSGSIAYGQTLIFISSDSGQVGPPAAVGLSYRTVRTDYAAPADSVDVSWDGETATIAAPDGYTVEPADREGCAAEQDQPNVVDCTVMGTPPLLLLFTTAMIGRPFLHATPPFRFVQAQISAPPGPATAGAAVTLSGSVGSFAGSPTAPAIQSWIWDFGDGTLGSGQTVSHAYASPGIYTPELILVGATGPITAAGTVIQILPTGAPLPPASVDVTYPSGWNLVAGPAGTILTGADGPLYRLGSAYLRNPHPSVPATTPLDAGAVYWAYFDRPTTVTLHGPGQPLAATPVPGALVPLGNPLTVDASVTGSAHLYVYDPVGGEYHEATDLKPGQGAWASTSDLLSDLLTALVVSYRTP